MNSLKLTMATVILMLSVVMASAQPYERVWKQNLWNDSYNVAGLREDSVSVSFAELYGKTGFGDFHRSHEASSLWSVGARAATIKHVTKFSMIGGFSFEQTNGKQMCGSMFIDPGLYPVDVLEFTPGRKTRQSYAFDGGIGVDLNENWRIGASMDFRSTNIAKRKDLRHTNYRLDMTLAPSIQYHVGNSSIGLSYIFSKDSETINAEQIGTGESSYYVFLDKGLMYGKHEVWSGSGVHLSEPGVDGFPVRRSFNGVAMQFYNNGSLMEVSYMHGSGTVGEKQSIWFRFPSNVFAIHNSSIGRVGNVVFINRYGVDLEWLKNYETVLDKVTDKGVTTTVEYGVNRILTRRSASLYEEYEWLSDHFDLLLRADWALTKSRASQMYPYIVKHSLKEWNFILKPTFHIGTWDMSLLLEWSDGKVKKSTFETDEESGVLTSLTKMEDVNLAYKTCGKLDAVATVRRNFSRGLYVQAFGGWRRAFGVKLIDGKNRCEAGVSLGLDF